MCVQMLFISNILKIGVLEQNRNTKVPKQLTSCSIPCHSNLFISKYDIG